MKRLSVAILVFLFLQLARVGALLASPNISESIILAGDSGDVDSATLELLRAEAAKFPQVTTVVLLGDNIYPAGLPPENSSDYSKAHSRLTQQLTALKLSGARIVFIPGNHDWDDGGLKGWEAVLREQSAVESALGPNSFLPRNGCPGPTQVKLSPNFQIIALDTQWWLHQGEKPSSQCDSGTKLEVVSKLRKLLASTPKSVANILVQHHPLRSYGLHGLGSECYQDFGCKEYQEMRAALSGALQENKPLICAGGHDHDLQVLRGGCGCQYFVVSGAMSNVRKVESRADTLYSSSKLGFVRVDKLNTGELRLSVLSAKPYQLNLDLSNSAAACEISAQ